jgi:hypothetical protein
MFDVSCLHGNVQSIQFWTVRNVFMMGAATTLIPNLEVKPKLISLLDP